MIIIINPTSTPSPPQWHWQIFFWPMLGGGGGGSKNTLVQFLIIFLRRHVIRLYPEPSFNKDIVLELPTAEVVPESERLAGMIPLDVVHQVPLLPVAGRAVDALQFRKNSPVTSFPLLSYLHL